MPRYRRLATVPITVTSSNSAWEYKHLTDIEILDSPQGRYARLLCEHDCGGEMFTATCSERYFFYLEPYAELLEASRADPIGIENPVVPIRFIADGRAYFSTQGARADHPHLSAPAKGHRFLGTLAPERGIPSRRPRSNWLQNLFRRS